jgi:hypothetical protein
VVCKGRGIGFSCVVAVGGRGKGNKGEWGNVTKALLERFYYTILTPAQSFRSAHYVGNGQYLKHGLSVPVLWWYSQNHVSV